MVGTARHAVRGRDSAASLLFNVYKIRGDCRIRRLDYGLTPCMKKLATFVLFGSGIVLLLGCASTGPSPEERANELERQRQAERQQAEFRKSLPPVTNPGRGE